MRENGLLGLEFDPDYIENGFVYVTHVARLNGGEVASVARLTDVNKRGEDFTMLLTGLPSAKGHQIENLRFCPDGLLYVFLCDAYLKEKVQDLDEQSPNNPADIAEGPDGSLYAGNIFQNKILTVNKLLESEYYL